MWSCGWSRWWQKPAKCVVALLQILQMLLVSTPLSASLCKAPHLHALENKNPLLLLFEEELFWLVFLLCLLNSEVFNWELLPRILNY